MLWDYGRIDPALPMPARGEAYNHSAKLVIPFIRRLGLPNDFDDTILRTPNIERWMENQTFGEGEENDDDANEDDVSVWHRDALDWQFVAVWSTNGPTEVRKNDVGDPIRLGTKHLMVFDNHKMQHRTGRFRHDPRVRFFFRAGIDIDAGWKPDPVMRVI